MIQHRKITEEEYNTARRAYEKLSNNERAGEKGSYYMYVIKRYQVEELGVTIEDQRPSGGFVTVLAILIVSVLTRLFKNKK